MLPFTTASRDGWCLSETGSQLTMKLVSLASTRLGKEEREKQERGLLSSTHPTTYENPLFKEFNSPYIGNNFLVLLDEKAV